MKLLAVLCGLIAVGMVASLSVNSGFTQSDGTKQDQLEEIEHSEKATEQGKYSWVDPSGKVHYYDPLPNNGTDEGPGNGLAAGPLSSMLGIGR
ncbi:hypothetical protein K1T71_004506 [Dendrolimus kikuchii]|uniref:Uncharacterized protein n=1 Tax=Dendrolimus kikuchii TaxID=765133 RepID=A0ACC1D7W3_9NEOP|nr:hypothetical protein K1T71_004506 [Dendrolimus kikuchii]